jgi:hypothetical protein
MPAGSSHKRERQYEHIKEGAEKRGTPEGRAEEIAARTVNKERALSGEAKTAGPASLRDPKPHPSGAAGAPTADRRAPPGTSSTKRPRRRTSRAAPP